MGHRDLVLQFASQHSSGDTRHALDVSTLDGTEQVARAASSSRIDPGARSDAPAERSSHPSPDLSYSSWSLRAATSHCSGGGGQVAPLYRRKVAAMVDTRLPVKP